MARIFSAMFVNLGNLNVFTKLTTDVFRLHIETIQRICSANQLTGFYMKGLLVVIGLTIQFIK